MTILSVIQSISSVIGIERPNSVFSSTEREHVELADLANEVGAEIAKEHEWQELTRLQSYTGNGTTPSYDLPDDYDRMLLDQEVWSSRFEGPLMHVIDMNDWLAIKVRDFSVTTGAWTMMAGEMVFHPVLENAEVAQFYYMSNLFARNEDLEDKAQFDADTDTFRLDERLLKLAMTWRWMAFKGMDYSEELATYERARGRETMRDGGPKMLRIGRRGGVGAKIAYPKAIPT